METYFNIRYEFDRDAVHAGIAKRLTQPGSDYICVADGVILDNVNSNPDYRKVVNGSMFSICDSSFVPLYIRWIYGLKRTQMCGSEIFETIIKQRKYRMCFLGTAKKILKPLRNRLSRFNPDVKNMLFYELPFCEVDEFDYEAIAKMIEADGSSIIWVALGAPKQEMFMAKLKQYLSHGVMIAVGAAFKFFSGVSSKRAPKWMVKSHLEFAYRLCSEPSKQFKRCRSIVTHLPKLLLMEYKNRRHKLHSVPQGV